VSLINHSDGLFLAAHTACVWEAIARKIGNVHRYSDFADVSLTDFMLSAGGLASAMQKGQPVGLAVLAAINNRTYLCRTNTNLGMALLLAPLARVPLSETTRGGIAGVLNGLTLWDSVSVYAAIRRAMPGGLGDSPEQDVRNAPTLPLKDIMKLAADRDMVARQYTNGFADVFDFGVPAFLEAFQQFGCVEAAIIDSQLRWLAQYPDSLIARKNGIAVAEDVQKRAAQVIQHGGIATPEGRAAGVALDQHLRSDGNKLNPGTTADLITACLFVALRENKVTPSAPFRWQVSDWL